MPRAIETDSHPVRRIEHEAESHSVELLPGESLAKAGASSTGASDSQDDSSVEVPANPSTTKTSMKSNTIIAEETPARKRARDIRAHDSQQEPEERQPESNASAPQNFGPNYKSSQNYSSRGASGPGQNFGRRATTAAMIADRIPAATAAVAALAVAEDAVAEDVPVHQEALAICPHRNMHRRKDPKATTRAAIRAAMILVRRARIVARNLAVSNLAAPSSAALIIAARTSSSSPATPNLDAAEEPILLPGESLAKYRGKPIAASLPR